MIPEMQHSALRIKKTNQILRCGDAREIQWIPDGSIDLVITSPPYWTLKEYPGARDNLVPFRATNSSMMNWIMSGGIAFAFLFRVVALFV